MASLCRVFRPWVPRRCPTRSCLCGKMVRGKLTWSHPPQPYARPWRRATERWNENRRSFESGLERMFRDWNDKLMQRISPDKPKPKPTMWTPPVIFGFTALAYGCGYSYDGESVVMGLLFAAAFLGAMIEARRRDKGN